MLVEEQNEFLGIENREVLEKIFGTKNRTVRNKKGYTKKLLIEIGLQILKIKDIKEGITINGYPKITIIFYKSPEKYEIDGKTFCNSSGRNADDVYDTINCTHLISNRNSGDFKSLWFRPFTNCFTKDMFNKIPKGKKIKCIIAHREEKFIVNGKQMMYEQGRNIGKPIILLKPEIISVYHIETPNDEIKIDYLKLNISLNA